MVKWIRVYKGAASSYLCKLVGSHYEIHAEGSSQYIQDLADLLNKEDAHGS